MFHQTLIPDEVSSLKLPVIRSRYSKCAFRIGTYYRDTPLGSATGFLYEHAGRNFIITNWHVVTGRHFLNGEILDPSGRIEACPTRIVLRLAERLGSITDASLYQWKEHSIELYNDGTPIWREHPDLGPKCDVVAIDAETLGASAKLLHTPANQVSDDRIPVEPGLTVFILGYPIGISVASGMGIWKSGYVASEPEFPIAIEYATATEGTTCRSADLPAFYIDSATRNGMSGSAVIARYTGLWDQNDPYASAEALTNTTAFGAAYEFLGCYSARLSSPDLEAGLGVCWSRDAIGAVCASSAIVPNPHIR